MANQSDLVQLVRRKAQQFLGTKGVTSVGVGYYKETDELCIQYTVEKKVPTESLKEEGLTELPDHILDEKGNKVRVQVIERRYKPHVEIFDETAPEYASFRGRRSRQDSVRPGISVAHEHSTAGTLGAIVYDRQTGQPYILSNWHVLQNGRGKIGDRILQPGPEDAGTRRDVVGRLVRSHIGLAGDCAISSIEGRGFDRTIWELGIVPQPVVGRVELGDRVIKSGRTTGVTRGIVSKVGGAYRIGYSDGVIKTVGGFEIKPDPKYPAPGGEISMGGDSGSVWMIAEEGENRGVVVGLHFAGETDPAPHAEHALACNIHSVIGKLDVTFRPPVNV